jgi:hypothetical protein
MGFNSGLNGLIPGNEPVPRAEEGGWVPGLVCTGEVKSKSPTGAGLTPNRPSCSESQYRQSHLGARMVT